MSLPVVKRDEKGISTLYVHDRPFFMRKHICLATKYKQSNRSDLSGERSSPD